MNQNQIYLLHQTPSDLAKRLIEFLPLEDGDVLCEPFRGEGAFYNHFPDGNPKVWAEIVLGKDYTAITEEYDWVITNPPFRLQGTEQRTNSFWVILDYFSQRARKGLAFLSNKKCLDTLTPRRLQLLEQRGWYVEKIVVCSVKKWAGRYYFLIFTKNPSSLYSYLRENW